VRVVLADDHQIVRDGLRVILEQAGMSVVGEAADGLAACSAVARLRPDVVVLDMAMPGMNGVEAAKHIVTEHPNVKIIALSMHSDERRVLAILSAGASGYVLKKGSGMELVKAIEAAIAGHTYLSPEVAGTVVGSLRDRPEGRASEAAGQLTTREREVLQLLAEGSTSKEIAAKLNIAVTTVETYRRQIMDKLEIRSIAELTKYAIREGLTSLER
jgi:DNA-binding NarL/FixJ family response regulator